MKLIFIMKYFKSLKLILLYAIINIIFTVKNKK